MNYVRKGIEIFCVLVLVTPKRGSWARSRPSEPQIETVLLHHPPYERLHIYRSREALDSSVFLVFLGVV